jgi:hypothetical protein
MLQIITKEGIELKKDEYEFIKIERNSLFLNIPVKDIISTDKIYFKYQDYINNNINTLKKEDINIISTFLTNLTDNIDFFELNINPKKFEVYKKLVNIYYKKETNNKFSVSFKDSSKKNINLFLTEFRKNILIKKYFKNNINNLKYLMNFLLLKNSIYKNNQIEFNIHNNFKKEIQEILFHFKIKSIIENNKLIINNKHSLMRLLMEFNIDNNLKTLKSIVKDIESEYLYIGENQTFFLSNIKEIKTI